MPILLIPSNNINKTNIFFPKILHKTNHPSSAKKFRPWSPMWPVGWAGNTVCIELNPAYFVETVKIISQPVALKFRSAATGITLGVSVPGEFPPSRMRRPQTEPGGKTYGC